MELILASTSPYRRALLERVGLDFRCVSPDVDEEAWKARDFTPAELAVELAKAKAEAVGRLFPEAIVIGGDQCLAFGEEVLGKPGSVAQAVSQLERLSGHTHELLTAIAVTRAGQMETHLDKAVLRLRRLTREEIERYVAADNPVDCAGSYKLEARGILLMEHVETADQTAIVGIPLIALSAMLRRHGLSLP